MFVKNYSARPLFPVREYMLLSCSVNDINFLSENVPAIDILFYKH